MNRIKVLIGVIGKGKGGVPTYAVHLFSHLDREKFDVTFLSNQPHPFYEQDILKLGGKIAVVPSRNRHPLAHRAAIRKLMRENQFQVCHINLSSASNTVPLEEAVKAGIPVVIAHSHNASAEGGTLIQLLHRRGCRILHRLPITRLACSGAAGRFMFGDRPFDFVPNAIDLDRFSFREEARQAMRDRLGLGDAFVVGHVGRLVPVKNQSFLLDVFAALKALHPNSRLLLCGDGPDEAALRQKARTLGIEEETIFLGNVSDPENAFCAMDAMMFPSICEGFGMVVVEAVGTGLPCLVSDRLPPEVEVNSLVQFFSLEEQPQQLAQKLLALKGTKRFSRREELAQAGYDTDQQTRIMEARYLGRSDAQITGKEQLP